MNHNSRKKRCAYCGSDSSIIWVHGHGQCANCGINIEECCRGERCEPNKQSEDELNPHSLS
jgi:hypothetical protein